MKICKRCGILYGDIAGICSKCGDPLVDVYGNASTPQKAPKAPRPEAISPLPLTVMKERTPHEDLNTRKQKQAKRQPTRRTGEKGPTKRASAQLTAEQPIPSKRTNQRPQDSFTQKSPAEETPRDDAKAATPYPKPEEAKTPERAEAEAPAPMSQEAAFESAPAIEVEWQSAPETFGQHPSMEDVYTPYVEQVPVGQARETEPVAVTGDQSWMEPEMAPADEAFEPTVIDESPYAAYVEQADNDHVGETVEQIPYEGSYEPYEESLEADGQPSVSYDEPEIVVQEAVEEPSEEASAREKSMWEILSASEEVDPDFVEDSFDPSLLDATDTRTCPRCGSVNLSDARVCAGCGADLESADEEDDALQGYEFHIGLKRRKSKKGLDSLVDKFKEFWAPVIAVLVIFITLSAGVAAVFLVKGVYAPNSGDAKTTETEQVYVPVKEGETSGDVQADQGVGVASVEGGPSIGVGFSSNLSSIVNGGYVCYGDANNIYYSLPTNASDWSTAEIVCADRAGNNIRDVYKGPGSTRTINHLSIVENYLVFSQVTISGSSVMAVRVDGSEVTELDTCDTYTLCQVDNGWVYYLKNGSLWRCDIKGDNKSELAYIGNANNWRVWGDKIYFYASDSAYLIYEADLYGDNQRVVYYPTDNHAIKNAYPVAEGRLVVFESDWSGSDGNVVYLNLNAEEPQDQSFEQTEDEGDGEGANVTQTGEEVVEEVPKRMLVTGLEVKRVCSDDAGIYYTVKGPDTTYRVGYVGYDGRAIGPEREIDDGGEVRYNCVLPEVNTLYYGVVTDTLICTFHGMDGIHGPVASIGEPFLVMAGRDLEGQA